MDKLIICIEHGDVARFFELAQMPFDVDAIRMKNERTLLHRAVENNVLPIVKFLVDHGADINNVHEKMTPLCSAVKADFIEVACYLLENGANVGCTHKDFHQPIHYSNSIEMTDLLLKNGADINAKDKYGNTVLHMIIDEYLELLYAEENYSKTYEHIRFLLMKGADYTLLNHCGRTFSELIENEEVAKELLKYATF